ncbi:amidohydrolase family protein [Gemmatimonas groenlandica]|uniref:Amidohydrolase family protein n=1 Tax=Gemmatimonas groenlandica TaxID=2732249 RepID=A0A6M4IRS5_9BACT|nr:amidohydrolase family protein [Gemmatimonas groenlandica]QJR36126.1 amidohydrolase family protein [Gemmatimonas groenlandica]
MSVRTLYTADWVLPISSAPIRHGAVLVEEGRIAFVGAARAVTLESSAGRTVALGNAVLMPGLVNAHSHLELTLLRGFLEGLDFRDWLRTLTTVRRDLMSESVLLDASRAGIREALRNGITCLADTTDSGAPLTAMREYGVRGVGYLEVFGPDPVQCAGAIAQLAARVREARAHDTALVRVGISPHAPYTVSRDLFAATAALSRSESLPMAVHVAESAAEMLFVRDGSGPFADRLRAREIAVAPQAESPIALLEATGLLAARPLLIHVIQADDRDLARIADAGATIVHCPISNAKLGHGIAPLDRMLAHGIRTGLGTDSVASNDRMDLLGEARQATLFASLRVGTPDALSAHEALALATRGGAEALGLAARVGTLETGKDADLAAFPLDHDDAQPLFDPAVALVHALAGKVEAILVTVEGRELVRNGALVQRDETLPLRVSAWRDRLQQWRQASTV